MIPYGRQSLINNEHVDITLNLIDLKSEFNFILDKLFLTCVTD